LEVGRSADEQLRQESAERDTRHGTLVDRQLREESIERDTGLEEWMKMGRDTARRVEEAVGRMEAGNTKPNLSRPGHETFRGYGQWFRGFWTSSNKKKTK